MLRCWVKSLRESLDSSVGGLADRRRDRTRLGGRDDGAKGSDGRVGSHGFGGIAC